MKESKSERSSKSTDLVYKIVGLGVVAVLFWVLFLRGGNKIAIPTQPNVIQSTAQLAAPKNGKAWGTVAKSSNGVNFELNVTAFLDKPAAGLGYYVYLKGNGADLKDMLIGKMTLSGDVYSLNYQSGKDLFGYKDIIVVKETEGQAQAGNMTNVVLAASFSK